MAKDYPAEFYPMNKTENDKIVQIIPYFGRWPEYFDLYLYSCSRNPIITFIFYTDCEIPDIVYPNTVFIHTTFRDYCSLVSTKLNITFTPPNAYKLADLKPFLAYIHADDIKCASHWSFGDLDLCFGDMSMIINNANLAKYDLITTHDYHIAGHFTLIRNNDYYRNLCFSIKNWKQLLEYPDNIAFDEIYWSNAVFPTLKYTLYFYDTILKRFYPGCFSRLMSFWNRLACPRCLFKEYQTSPEPKETDNWTFNLESGKIYDSSDREIPYLHFLFFKNHPQTRHSKWGVGYYQLSKPIKDYSRIIFSTDSIKGCEK